MSFNPTRIIERKRDGGENTPDELAYICTQAVLGAAAEMQREQLSAWLMAVVWRGMTIDETAALTKAMVKSGQRLDLSELPHPWTDKHSTGGVGDKTTLVLLPMLAACGLTVVKMSGRGLGKTGGTIDKLESLPGFRTQLSIEEMIAQAKQVGIALTGQTPQLAPADGVLYALRDVTATVKSIPLIASSVLSKKIAGGAEAIGIDLKCGSGAFMTNLDEARELAGVMKAVGEKCGIKIGIEITDMDQPLGKAVGNALEVIEAVETLQGRGPTRFTDLCIELCASMLVTAGVHASREAAEAASKHSINSGDAFSKAGEWFETQGSTLGIDHVHRLASAPIQRYVRSDRGGWAARVDAGLVGETAVDFGAGRQRAGDSVDHAVGIEVLIQVGDDFAPGRELFLIHARTEADADKAEIRLREAVQISETKTEPNPVLIERV